MNEANLDWVTTFDVPDKKRYAFSPADIRSIKKKLLGGQMVNKGREDPDSNYWWALRIGWNVRETYPVTTLDRFSSIEIDRLVEHMNTKFPWRSHLSIPGSSMCWVEGDNKYNWDEFPKSSEIDEIARSPQELFEAFEMLRFGCHVSMIAPEWGRPIYKLSEPSEEKCVSRPVEIMYESDETYSHLIFKSTDGASGSQDRMISEFASERKESPDQIFSRTPKGTYGSKKAEEYAVSVLEFLVENAKSL